MDWWQFTTGRPAFSSAAAAVAQHSGYCLDDPGQSTADGTQYRQYTCGAGAEQRFDFHPVPGVADTYFVVNRSSGKCLDVSGISTAVGALVHQWTCDSASALATKKNQVWRLTGKS